MSNKIVEYVGNDGVKSSEADGFRLSRPRPGDLVEWTDGKTGKIWEVGTGHCEPDQVHICASEGSAFLGHSGGGRVYVDISGGPFTIIKRDQLAEMAHTLKLTRFWNWGDNMMGAHQGVEYWLARPVFKANRPTPS